MQSGLVSKTPCHIPVISPKFGASTNIYTEVVAHRSLLLPNLYLLPMIMIPKNLTSSPFVTS